MIIKEFVDCLWKLLNFAEVKKILPCILGDVAGGGSMAVAVGVSDMRQVTGDTRHVTHDT